MNYSCSSNNSNNYNNYNNSNNNNNLIVIIIIIIITIIIINLSILPSQSILTNVEAASSSFSTYCTVTRMMIKSCNVTTVEPRFYNC